MAPDSVRLNYTISKSTNDLLEGYCELTGRTASDLVRQLVSEILENDRPLPPKEKINDFLRSSEKRDCRTDMWLSSRCFAVLDEKLETEGYPGKSIVIAFVLSDFLSNRANHAMSEMVRFTTLVDRVTFTQLAFVASQRRQRVEDLVVDLCREFVTRSNTNHQNQLSVNGQ